jgi:hypothetical protein
MCQKVLILSILLSWGGIAGAQTCPTFFVSDNTLGTRTSFDYKGGVTRVQVQPGSAGCAWQLTNIPAWVTVLGPTSGTQKAILVLGIETNTATTSRTATGEAALEVNNFGRFSITQGAAPAGCTFSLQSPSANVPANGVTSQNQINSTAPTCQWVSFSDKNWLQLYPIEGTGTTPFSYTVFPNFSTGTRNAIGNVGAQKLSIVQVGATGTPNERLVRLLYFNFIGRLPAPNEVAFHVQNLNNGMSREDLAVNFLNSLEFNLGGRFIAGTYVGLLVRDAEFNGWLFQRNDLSSSGRPPEFYAGNFINSAEYRSKHGTPNNEEFVRLLYRYILQRTPSDSEVQGQVNALNSQTRAQLATSFLNSAEFRNGRDPRLLAFLVYATLLSRDPSPIEFDARLQQIQNATDSKAVIRTIIQEIMNSSEFTAGLS